MVRNKDSIRLIRRKKVGDGGLRKIFNKKQDDETQGSLFGNGESKTNPHRLLSGIILESPSLLSI